MIFFTSDTHYGHKKVLEYSKRPFPDVESMERELVARWNSVVGHDDVVYHLGDFAFQRPRTFPALIGRLNGCEIHIVPGNHDNKDVRKKLAKCDRVIMEPMYVRLKVPSHRIILCHFPIESWDQMKHGSIHIHGHSHGGSRQVPNRFDAGVDCNDFTPRSLDYFLARAVASSPRPDREFDR